MLPTGRQAITDFWRRWHISLSTWLRDYLYIPLGGNRLGVTRMYLNLMIVMLLGGLWHGANWTFVVWGAYHGVLLIADRLGAPVFRRLPRLVYQVQTLFMVVLGWVLFRSTDFGMAMGWLERMFTPGPWDVGAHGTTVGWIVLGLVSIAFVPETWDFKFKDHPAWAFVWAACLLGVYLFMNGAESVFLYYQF